MYQLREDVRAPRGEQHRGKKDHENLGGFEIKQKSQSPHPLQSLATMDCYAVNDAWTNEQKKTRYITHAHAAMNHID